MSLIQLSNIDPVIMTPVTHYIVFYGTSEPLLNVTTSNNRTNTVTIGNLKQGGNYTVGVAAVNSGGLSETTFFARKIGEPGGEGGRGGKGGEGSFSIF